MTVAKEIFREPDGISALGLQSFIVLLYSGLTFKK